MVSTERGRWFLAEVKSSGKRGLNPNLEYFQGCLKADHAFQIAFDLPFVDRDCFQVRKPVRVPARSLLSQLV